ncbi:hypothetical protein ONS95_003007 [Cadophora gregata]|uniref:uncharacterized protein n=1 Tax=Cadophora gregata TaxID=51156 RepID=UPI0026DCDF4F|nr:uncharacterized protein ONS95_003007 [Cadophora gregata]KAK0108185.1 hypothetical protein ONS95_003007 [Cadophora gregata]
MVKDTTPSLSGLSAPSPTKRERTSWRIAGLLPSLQSGQDSPNTGRSSPEIV